MSDLDREIRAHLDAEAEEQAQQGVPDPQFAARRAFGNVTQVREDIYESSRSITVQQLAEDIRHALRGMRRAPLHTALALLTLTLGIGANSAIFSVLHSVLLAPLPYPDAHQLVTIGHQRFSPVAPANFYDIQKQSQSFSHLAAATVWRADVTGIDHPFPVTGLQFTSGMFPLLGVAPARGRAFQPEDHEPGKHRVVILAHSLWQQRFSANPNILGTSISLNNAPHTIIGIMPPMFSFPPYWVANAELWLPAPLDDSAANRRMQMLRIFGRLKPGVTPATAQTELDTIWHSLESAYPLDNANMGIRLTPLQEKVTGDVRPSLLVLAAAVGFALLIACANLANLSLARSIARQRELAIRVALGANRFRLIRQLLTESLVLAGIGGLAGAWLAYSLVNWFRTLPQTGIPRLAEISLDPTALAFTALLTIATGLLSGLFPALVSSRSIPAQSLRDGGRNSSATTSSTRFRSMMVVLEVALSIVLLTAAGLLVRSFAAMRAIDPGFDPNNLLSLQISIAGQTDLASDRREIFYNQILQSVHALPGIEAASMVNHLPIGGDQWGALVHAEGDPLPTPGQETRAIYRVAHPGYFSTLRNTLLAGREFSTIDSNTAPQTVIINQRLAQRLFPNQSAIGKRITRYVPNASPVWLTVVGVVSNIHQQLLDAPELEFYIPFSQDSSFRNNTDPHYSYMTLIVRTKTPPAQIIPAIESAISTLNKNAVLSRVLSLEQIIGDVLFQPRFYLFTLTLFAAFATFLAAMGIYGVMANAVSSRQQEIGIRMALGAPRSTIVWSVLRHAALLSLAGTLAGLLLAGFATKTMSSMLYHVTPTDPLTFTMIPIVTAAVVLIAAFLPVRRASSIDPITALRT